METFWGEIKINLWMGNLELYYKKNMLLNIDLYIFNHSKYYKIKILQLLLFRKNVYFKNNYELRHI